MPFSDYFKFKSTEIYDPAISPRWRQSLPEQIKEEEKKMCEKSNKIGCARDLGAHENY